MSTLEIHRTLVLCTSHITEDDGSLLDAEDDPSLVSYDLGDSYGWLVYIGDPEHASYKALTINGYSDAFVDAVRLARTNQCAYIRFDPDGPEVAELPTFDW